MKQLINIGFTDSYKNTFLTKEDALRIEDTSRSIHGLRLKLGFIGVCEFSFTLGDIDPNKLGKKLLSAEKQTAFVVIEVLSAENKVNFKFVGLIESVSCAVESTSAEFYIAGSGLDGMLNSERKYSSFYEKKIPEVIKSVFDRHSSLGKIPLKIDLKGNVGSLEIPSLVQYNESDLEFLTRLSMEFGFEIWFNGTEFIVANDIKSKKGKTVQPFNNNHTGQELSYNLRTMNGGLRFWNEKKVEKEPKFQEHFNVQKELKSVFQKDLISNNMFRRSETLRDKSSVSGFDQGEDLNFAKNSWDRQNLRNFDQQRILRFTESKSRYKLLECITLKPFKDSDVFDNPVRIIEQSITFDGTKLYSSYLTTPSNIKTLYCPYFFNKPVACIQRAVVVDNIDPDKIGRVKVRFFWQSKEESSPWIRMIYPHVHEEGGVFIPPQVDSEVYIDFEMKDPTKPIVLGSVYNNSHLTANWEWTEKVQELGIRTKSGSEIKFRDEKGKEEITLITRANDKVSNQITLSHNQNDNLVKIYTSGDLELEAEKNISIKAGKQLKASSKSKLSIDTDGSASIKSKSKMKLNGSIIDLNC